MKDSDKKRLTLTAELFKAIGHPDRLALLERLAVKPWCVCELAESLGLNKSVVSKHLSLLHTTGLIELEKKGTQVIYTLVVPCVIDMGRCSYLAVLAERKKRLES